MKHEARFTPGPWRVGRPGNIACPCCVLDADGRRVALVSRGQQGRSANANLIAAAPDMYAALEAFAQDTILRGKDHAAAVVAAHAALRKARGEQ